MTCSARLPVYILLVGLLLPSDARVGVFNARGVVMFALYLTGAVSAMLAAAVCKRLTSRRGGVLPFYMEMPPYQVPRMQTVAAEVWTAASAFLRKVTSIILATTVVLWVLLNLPLRSEAELATAGVDTADEVAVAAYTLDNSYAAAIGRAVSTARPNGLAITRVSPRPPSNSPSSRASVYPTRSRSGSRRPRSRPATFMVVRPCRHR